MGRRPECKKCTDAKRLPYMMAHKNKKRLYDKNYRNKNYLKLSREKWQYRHSPNGYMIYLYINMKHRVLGHYKHNQKYYKGLEILPKAHFYRFVQTNKNYLPLFSDYSKNGFRKRFAPSVNRINPRLGYSLNNIEIIPMWKNAQLSNLTQRSR